MTETNARQSFRLNKNSISMVDAGYLRYLMGAVGEGLEQSSDYTNLLRTLHERRFVVNRYDQNRAVDGIALREEYAGETENGTATVLEMLIALSRRAAYANDLNENPISSEDWFWKFMFNLELDGFTDYMFNQDGDIAIINMIVSDFVNRDYRTRNIFGLDAYVAHGLDLWGQMQYYATEITGKLE